VTAANAADVPRSAGVVTRLASVVARQRRELDEMRAQAAKRSLVDMAQGMLMERLGMQAAEARSHLARLAEESGTPLAELAADVTGQHVAQVGEPPVPGDPGLRRLSVASAALLDAPDGEAIAVAALDEVLAHAGASAVMLWLIGPDGYLDLAGQAGLEVREAGRWRHLPPDMDCLPQRAVRGGTELFWRSGPGEPGQVPLPGHWVAGGQAVLPMGRPGPVIGVLAALWPGPLPDFSQSFLRQLTALADLCGHALASHGRDGDPAPVNRFWWLYGLLDGVIESCLFASPLRGEGGTVADFQISHVGSDFRDPAGRKPADLAGRPLLEVYPLAALPGGLFDRAVEVLTSGVPHRMSGGILSALTGEAGATAVVDIRIARFFDGVVIAWRRVDEAERLASLLQHAERLGRIGGWEENLLTGEIRWTESALALFGREAGSAIPLAGLHTHVVADDSFDVEHFREAVLREKRAAAAAFRIIREDDQSVRQMRVFAEPVTDPAGALVAVRGAFQDVSTHYHTQVALTATRDRLADTEERAEEEHRLAARLQQAITPWSSEPVASAGLDMAARYRPAGPARLVSGDWYDAVILPGGQVLLVVGDIAGHGIDAVTGMVEMRNCLRGLAITGAGPATLLKWLNEIACHLTAGTVGTAVCGMYDPGDRRMRWARAGHLAPVLVRDGVARELPLPGGLMLGADPGACYEEVIARLRLDDVLLLFTDGLIERRDAPIDEAVAALLENASRPVGAIADYADHLMRHAAANTGDDACLVAVHVR
jgi:PAS domain-containing protein